MSAMPGGRLPQGDDKAPAVRRMFDAISHRYDLVNRVMTFGLDVRWRRRTVTDLRLAPGSIVYDLACGTGDFCNDLERAGIHAVGFDFSFGMLSRATTRVPLVQADIQRMPVADASVDGTTCGFALRNVTSIPALFAECARIVRDGGRVAFLEANDPDNPVLRAGHSLYFRRIVPLVGGLLSDRSAYRYLPDSMAYLPGPAEMVAMLREAGFPDARRIELTGGAAQLLIGTRRR